MTIDVRVSYHSGMRLLRIRPQIIKDGQWVDDVEIYQRVLTSRGDEYELCVHGQRRLIVEEVGNDLDTVQYSTET